MGTPTQYYVDPSLGSDTGDGSVGTPWGRASGSVIQYALNTITRNATNGDQINVKAGTDDTLGAALSLATYGTPSFAAPLTIRGYTSAANDGGIGGIDGAATYAVFTGATTENFHFIDLHLHNCGAATILTLDRFCSVQNCELDNTTGSGISVPTAGTGVLIANNHFHNIGAYGVTSTATETQIVGNYFANGTNDFTSAIYADVYSVTIERNIITIDGTSRGIELNGTNVYGGHVRNNSVLCAGGTGAGIDIDRLLALEVVNNVVEGFSGAGGKNYDFHSSGDDAALVANNASYNGTTGYANAGDYIVSSDNESLGSSPFAKSGADTFANRFTYFEPADVGNVRGGAYPSGCRLDKGAVQHSDPAGGGSINRGILTGGRL